MLSSLTAKYSSEDCKPRRTEVLFYVAVHFFLNKEPGKSLTLLKNIEDLVPDSLVANVVLLKTLINLFLHNLEETVALVNVLLFHTESGNIDLLTNLVNGDLVSFISNCPVPPLHSRQSLHLLLILADVMLKKEQFGVADKLIREYLEQASRLGSNHYHSYSFLLQFELVQATKTLQEQFVCISAIEPMAFIFHRLEYSLMIMKFYQLLYRLNRHLELSIYELGHDLDRTDHVYGDPQTGFLVDMNDWSPTSRFDVARNSTLRPPEADPSILMLRIKLCPQIFGYCRSVRVEFVCGFGVRDRADFIRLDLREFLFSPARSNFFI